MSEYIHSYVAGSRPETLLLLHGTGGNETDLLPLGEAVLPGAALLSPRGQVMENGMARFFRRFAQGVFDVPDVKRRAAELGEFLREMAGKHGFDLGRVEALGYSNGANMAAAMLLTGAARFQRAVLVRAMAVLERRELGALPDLEGTEVLLAQGLYDPMGNGEQTQALAELLKKAGARVEVRMQPAGHQMTPADVEAARAWLEGG